MRVIIIALTFLMISAVYMLEVSMAQAHTLTIHEITYVDEYNQVIHRDYFATGADLSNYDLPTAPNLEGFVFVGWIFEVPEHMPNADIIVHAQYIQNIVILSHSI